MALETLKQAIDKGYTRSCIADADEYTLYLMIKPDADLDGRFTAYDTECDEYIRVNGWMFTFEISNGTDFED